MLVLKCIYGAKNLLGVGTYRAYHENYSENNIAIYMILIIELTNVKN